jgi:hypothetical protein
VQRRCTDEIQSNLIDMCTYVAGMVCIKFSILLLYRRIFPSQTFGYFLLALGAYIAAWGLAAFFCGIFLCVPMAAMWDPTVKGRCIDYGKVTLVIAILNILNDFTILAFPMPLIWKLQMSFQRKLLVFLTFMIGCMYVFTYALKRRYAYWAQSLLCKHCPAILREENGINSRFEL